jgi:hypothetical protein
MIYLIIANHCMFRITNKSEGISMLAVGEGPIGLMRRVALIWLAVLVLRDNLAAALRDNQIATA